MDFTLWLIGEPFENNLDFIWYIYSGILHSYVLHLYSFTVNDFADNDRVGRLSFVPVRDCQGRPCFLKCYCDFNIFPLSTSNMLVPKWRHGFRPRRFRLGIAINPTKCTDRVGANAPFFRFGSIKKINFLAQWILLSTLKIKIQFLVNPGRDYSGPEFLGQAGPRKIHPVRRIPWFKPEVETIRRLYEI